MKHVFCLFIITIICLFIFTPIACAVTVNILNAPSTITSDPLILTASISGAATGTNYLRVDVYKEGTSNYFGETFNSADWYSGSDGKQYLPISVQSGIFWNGTIQTRIGNPSTTDYDGTGNYRIRIRRYTSSGGQGSEDANNSSIPIAISLPTPTTNPPTATNVPTSITAPTLTKTSTPTKIPTIATAVASPTKTPVSKAVGKTPTPTKKNIPTAILGQQTKNQDSQSPTSTPSAKTLGVASFNLASVLIGLGVLCFIACGILLFRSYKRGDFFGNG